MGNGTHSPTHPTSAETQLLKSLPRMAKASHPELKAAFTDHLAVTEGQVERLERTFEELGGGGGTAQRVEHYEIAGYGCVRTFDQLLGCDEAEPLLQETLDEEGEADKKLTALAEPIINVEAEEAGEDEEEPAAAGSRRNGRESFCGCAPVSGHRRSRLVAVGVTIPQPRRKPVRECYVRHPRCSPGQFRRSRPSEFDPAEVAIVASKQLIPMLLILLQPSSLLACPFCDGGPSGVNEVRAEVFSPDFWSHALAVAAPFAVMAAVVTVLLIPRRRPHP